MIEKNLRIRGANLEIADAVVQDITPGSSQDLEVNLSDNAGARALVIKDSDGATVAKIDSNGLLTSATGLAGPVTGAVTGTLTGDVTKGSTDLSITAASAKDIIMKLGDASGAKKVLVKDSANALQASIDSDGIITGTKVVAPLPSAATDTDGEPSQAEMVSAFGAAAIGKEGIYVDTHAATGVAYHCFASATTWYYSAGTAGA